jgi:hypothetical protein
MKLPLFFIAYLSALSPALAVEVNTAFFEQKIRPALIEHCYECHSASAKKLKGGLYLDSKAGWQKGGDSGQPAIIPGKPAESLLIRTIQHLEPDLEMPPKKPKLAASIIADFTEWIKSGANDPRTSATAEVKRADKTWWSLQPLQKLKSNSIDDFIAAKLEEKHLNFSPPADPRTLIRRMTYDLHGLPPTPEEVDAFVAKPSVPALVDRLLASPRYGERWGRNWLDVIRFGESNGFERNFIIDDLWPFRDYVIRSINEDKPFDQFITEHLAGDVIGKDKPEVEVGSAFLVAGPYDDVGNQDVVAQKNIRAATLDDMITATGSAFLGLTINCARCHHHKFDPIPTEDYYRMRAAFEGVTHGRRVIATKAERQAHQDATGPLEGRIADLTRERSGLEKAIHARSEAALAKMKFYRPKIDLHGTEENFSAVAARQVRFVIHDFTNDYQDKGRVGGGKLTEFQVWSSDGRNVALSSSGTKADGARSATADDFPEAYGPQYCIDGQLGEAWFIGNPSVLTLTLPREEKIDRIVFINARGDRSVDDSRVRGATPTSYEVQVSSDGKQWTTVATEEGREPWSRAHGIALARKEVETAEEKKHLATTGAELKQLQAQLAQVKPLPQVWAGNFAQPKERTTIHRGGDPMKPGAEVVPASLSVLDHVKDTFSLPHDADEGQRRLALAKWITSARNPLTARVLANRVWQYHFGTGIVDTPSDFGFLGSQPTHPELLDYLAARLIANGWRLKALHREIMLTRSYQQRSDGSIGSRVDSSARLLWRFPTRRLSAEEVRDTILFVSGKLQLEPMGGPGFRLYKYTSNNVSTYFPLDVHGPETYRRAVYHQNARASIVDLLSDFDLPDIAFAAPKRSNTTTPLQALTMLNHRFTLDMAAALAERAKGTDAITKAWRLCYQRPPSASEQAAATEMMQKHGLTALCRTLLNTNELIYLE